MILLIRNGQMDKWLMVKDYVSTTLIHEDAYKNPKNVYLFVGETEIINEFNTETWEEARDLYNAYIDEHGK